MFMSCCVERHTITVAISWKRLFVFTLQRAIHYGKRWKHIEATIVPHCKRSFGQKNEHLKNFPQIVPHFGKSHFKN